MRRISRFGLAGIMFLSGCTSVHLVTWKATDFSTKPYKKILTCAVTKDPSKGEAIEKGVELASDTYPVVVDICSEVIPHSAHFTATQMAEKIKTQGYDAILVVEPEPVIRWSQAPGTPPKNHTLSEFLNAYAVAWTPSAVAGGLNIGVSEKLGGEWQHVRGIFRLFDVRSGRLVWKAQQTAKAPASFPLDYFAKDVAERNLRALAKEGLILSSSEEQRK